MMYYYNVYNVYLYVYIMIIYINIVDIYIYIYNHYGCLWDIMDVVDVL